MSSLARLRALEKKEARRGDLHAGPVRQRENGAGPGCQLKGEGGRASRLARAAGERWAASWAVLAMREGERLGAGLAGPRPSLPRGFSPFVIFFSFSIFFSKKNF